MTEPDYSGMTVNERLFAAGLLDEFDVAVEFRDQENVIAILTTVQISPSQARSTVESLFADPKRYGF